jgi:hypothetical protein
LIGKLTPTRFPPPLEVALETAYWKADSPKLKETVSLAEIQNHAEHVMEVRSGFSRRAHHSHNLFLGDRTASRTAYPTSPSCTSLSR